jgi:hypothetical protein
MLMQPARQRRQVAAIGRQGVVAEPIFEPDGVDEPINVRIGGGGTLFGGAACGLARRRGIRPSFMRLSAG